MKSFLFCVALTILFCPALRAGELVVVCAETGYMPYYSADAKSGMFIDFLREFVRENPEYSFVFKPVPRKRMSVMMERGWADIFSLNIRDRNANRRYLSTKPVWRESSHVFMRKDSSFEVNSPKDLAGKQLGTISGNAYPSLEAFFRNGTIAAISVSTSHQLFGMLMAKRIDAFAGDRSPTLFRLREEGLSGSIVCSPVPLAEFDLVIELQKRHAVLAGKLDRFIVQSQANGFLRSLEVKYSR